MTRIAGEDWNPAIEQALEQARRADDHVPFAWGGVTIRVHPNDEPVDVRRRWRAARWDAERST